MSTLPGLAFVVLLLSSWGAAAQGIALKKDVELRGSAAAGKDGPLFLTADKIVVMENGQIKSVGNHQQLLEQCAIYKRLYSLQFGDQTQE